jgi:hypothetical protein
VTARKPVKPTKHAKPAKAKTTVKKARTSKKAAKKVSSKASAAQTAQRKAALAVAHKKHEEHLAHMAHIGQPVSLAIGDWLPVCAFEAVAQSLRLAGARVHDDDVAGLWHLLGEPEATSVGDALAAAALFGLAGYRPAFAGCGLTTGPSRGGRLRAALIRPFALAPRHQAAASFTILAVDRPGPHAVLATADGWWSWGELYDPWPCRVSEAWAVSWA